jgi:hypothetical protein
VYVRALGRAGDDRRFDGFDQSGCLAISSALLVFVLRMTSQTFRQGGSGAPDPRFIEHVTMTAFNFDDVDRTLYDAAPAEPPVKIPADRAEAATKE